MYNTISEMGGCACVVRFVLVRRVREDALRCDAMRSFNFTEVFFVYLAAPQVAMSGSPLMSVGRRDARLCNCLVPNHHSTRKNRFSWVEYGPSPL